jgi:hypothetical protein
MVSVTQILVTGKAKENPVNKNQIKPNDYNT